MVVSLAELGTYIGYLGSVLTGVYMLSPAPTALKIFRARDAQDFSPFPYITGVFNCSLWVYYSMITMAAVPEQDLRPNQYINAFGVLAFGSYVSVFIACSARWTRALFQMSFALLLLGLCVGTLEYVVPVLDWNFHLGNDDVPLKSSLCGVLTDILATLMYGSPLVVLQQVIRTRSVEFMPLEPSLLTLVICTVWTMQGFLIGNITVVIPNFVGMFLGLAQVLLYCRYCKNRPGRTQIQIMKTPLIIEHIHEGAIGC